MPRGAQLMDRDRDIIDALTKCVRVLTLNQIGRVWWADSKDQTANARSRLQVLEIEGLVQLQRVPAHPELPLEKPIFTWVPGGPAPDAGSVSYRLQERWKEHPVSTFCVSATRTAVNRFGGYGGRFPRQVERTHDIHLSAVYLLYREHKPALLSGWIFEEQLRQEGHRRGQRLPDVILKYAGTKKAVEFGGAYPKSKVSAFHRYCEERQLAYELW